MEYIYSNDQFFDISVRGVMPRTDGVQTSGYFNIGYGRNFPIIPDIISPGIYIETGLGADWIYLTSLFSGNHDESKDNYEFGYNFGYNVGFRLFNIIDISIFDITMFAGYNLSVLLFNSNEETYRTIHNPIIGFTIAIRLRSSTGLVTGLGFEYAYYIPTIFSNRIAFQHFAFLFRFRDRYWDK